MAAMAMMTIFIGYNNYIYEYKQKRQKHYFGFWNIASDNVLKCHSQPQPTSSGGYDKKCDPTTATSVDDHGSHWPKNTK